VAVMVAPGLGLALPPPTGPMGPKALHLQRCEVLALQHRPSSTSLALHLSGANTPDATQRLPLIDAFPRSSTTRATRLATKAPYAAWR
jgi:hypothetical protein